MHAYKFLALAASAVFLGGGAAAAVVSPASADTNAEALAFRDITMASTFVDLGKNGVPVPGDFFLFHEDATKHGVVVEYNDSQCLVALAGQYLCHVVVVVNGRGQITIDGSIPAPGGAFPTDFDLAITGGTGAFASARGRAHVHHISDTVSEDTLYLEP
jgi:hypothetical protein